MVVSEVRLSLDGQYCMSETVGCRWAKDNTRRCRIRPQNAAYTTQNVEIDSVTSDLRHVQHLAFTRYQQGNSDRRNNTPDWRHLDDTLFLIGWWFSERWLSYRGRVSGCWRWLVVVWRGCRPERWEQSGGGGVHITPESADAWNEIGKPVWVWSVGHLLSSVKIFDTSTTPMKWHEKWL